MLPLSRKGMNRASDSIATISNSQYVIGSLAMALISRCPPPSSTIYLSFAIISVRSKKATDPYLLLCFFYRTLLGFVLFTSLLERI